MLGDLADTQRAALDRPDPAMVGVAVDPIEPPVPGKVTHERAQNFGPGFRCGQPNRSVIATTLLADRFEERRA